MTVQTQETPARSEVKGEMLDEPNVEPPEMAGDENHDIEEIQSKYSDGQTPGEQPHHPDSNPQIHQQAPQSPQSKSIDGDSKNVYENSPLRKSPAAQPEAEQRRESLSSSQSEHDFYRIDSLKKTGRGAAKEMQDAVAKDKAAVEEQLV